MRNWRITLTLGALLGSFALSQGQSINIDLNDPVGGPETGAGLPSSAFGAAANQPGFWNGVTASGSGPFSLRGLDGQPTSVQMTASGGIGSMGGYNNPNLTGDFRLLMADYGFVLGANYETIYHLSGFTPGNYSIVTYACVPFPNNPVDMTVTVPGATEPIQHISGPITPNVFIRGVTNSVHELVLTGTFFEVSVRRTVPGPPNDSVCNGFQIVAVPEPLTIFAFSFGLLGLIAKRKRRI